MQKTLNTAATLATLILFAAVAVSSKATMAILAGYGFVFLYFGPVALVLFMARRWKATFGTRAPKALRATGILYPALVTALLVLSIVSPENDNEWSAEQFTTFGMQQILGLVGFTATVLVALLIADRRRRGLYRNCPFCYSRIRREATRCAFCTSEVEPESLPGKITEQRPVAATGTGSNFRRSPLVYAEPGRRKRDLGRLSVPRVIEAAVPGERTRPLPSELAKQRRSSKG